MKRFVYTLIVCVFLLCPHISIADDFLGVPLVPEGVTIQQTDTRIELKTNASHNEILAFYKEALKDYEDIKFREWKDATYIEDDGKLIWHSITISKGDPQETSIIIVKDNWIWIIGTLIIRYIGVFVVLIVLFLCMSISGSIISRSIKKSTEEKARG